MRRLFFITVIFLAAFSNRSAAQSPYQAQIDRWKMQDALHPPPRGGIVFVGSSSIRVWEYLARDFADYDVIQRGFGGSQFADLNQFVDELVLDYDPAAVCVFEGTNDVAAGKTAQTVFDDYLTFVDLVRDGQAAGSAPIPILYIGITPTPARWPLWSVASQANGLIQAHAATDPSLVYMDIPTPFLATGQPPVASLFQPDQLHLSPAGYAIWTSVIRPALRGVVAPMKIWRPDPQGPSIGERLLFDFGPDNPDDGNPTGGPDAFGRVWNDWYSVDGGLPIYAGEHLGGLVTTAGSPTGIELVITGEFQSNGILNGGLLEPNPALLGQLAIATATQDFFFGDDVGGTTSMGFVLHRLDPNLTYDLRFFASRLGSQSQTTTFTLIGARTHAKNLVTTGTNIGAGGVYDGNDDTVLTFRRIAPDSFGQVFVDLSKATGNFGYIGLMEIVVRPPVRGRDRATIGPR